MGLKGSQTERNILTAFAGESQARNRYNYFASQAKKDGYVQISDIFAETADQEKEHAKRLFKLLEGGEVEIQAAFPAGVIGSTVENLKEGAGGEHYGYVSGLRGGRARGRVRRHCNDIRVYRRSRETARETVSRSGGKHRKWIGVQEIRTGCMAVPQLRVLARRD